MLDLEHLEALDDDAPPEPDLGPVRRRVGRMRARRRWTAAVAGVAVLAGAVAATAAVDRTDHVVQVAGPSSPAPTTVPPTPEAKPSVSGTLPNGVKIALTLDTPTVRLGDDIHATVVLRNDGSETKTLGVDPIQCAVDVGPVLRDAGGKVVINDANGGYACYDLGVGLAPGKTRSIAVVVPTSTLEIPAPQRDAQYYLALEREAGLKPAWSLPPVPVEVVVPEGITARLELPKTTYPAGYSLEGTLVFVNGTGRPVGYHIDCTRKQPWDVLLSKNGLLFENTAVGGAAGCTPKSGTTAHLAPGETRVPFYATLGYPGCSNLASPSTPACTGNPPGIPDLPPGRYQLVFRGTGAPFDSIDAAPLDITVTARGDASAPVTDTLPKIGSDNAAAAQDEFARLYGMEFAPYRDQLHALGVDVVDYGPSGNQLLIDIKASPNAGAERDILLSLFAHPDLVTVQEGVIIPH